MREGQQFSFGPKSTVISHCNRETFQQLVTTANQVAAKFNEARDTGDYRHEA
jgi:hypothetical protein